MGRPSRCSVRWVSLRCRVVAPFPPSSPSYHPSFSCSPFPPSPYRFPSSSRRFPFFPWSPPRFSSGHPSSSSPSSSSCFPPRCRRCRRVSLLPLPVVFPSSPFSSCFPPHPPLPYSFPLLQPLLFVMSPLVAFPSPRDLIHLSCHCCLIGLPAVSSIHLLCCRFACCVFDWSAGSSIGVRVVDFPAASSIDPPCCR